MTTNMTTNNNFGKTNIFFLNGMDNNFKTALDSANLIENLTGQKVGLIVNNTGGLKSDIAEFLPNQLYLKDALNGEALQQINNQSSNQKNLIIAHSAGNEDIRKSAEILAMNNVKLNNIDFISVGSPISKNTLQKALAPVGINVVGQYNNWKDLVTNFKTWAVGTVVFGTVLAVVGSEVGLSSMPILSSSSSYETFFNTVLGAGVGAGVVGFKLGKYNLQLQHPFSTYHEGYCD